MQPVIFNNTTPDWCRYATSVRWRWSLLGFAALSLMMALVVQPVSAESPQGLDSAANSFVQPNRGPVRIIGLNQAIRIAQEESGGQVLSAKSVRRPNGALIHRVRVLVDNHRVMTMVVDQHGRLRRGR